MSDFTIGIEFEETDGNYHSVVTIENVGGSTATNLVLQFVITESKLPIVWGGMSEQDWVNRLMVPNQNGTALDFSGGNTQVVELDFNTSYWDVDNCAIVAFVQNNTTKEILQGTQKFLAVSQYAIDAEAKAVIHPVGEYCGSSVTPIVKIKNMGSENLTSLDIEYSINGETPQSYAWTGDLAFNLGEDVELPEISFTSQAVNTFEFSVSNPNGQTDPNPDNDVLEATFDAAYAVSTSTVLFELKTDNYPEETTWDVKNSAGDVIYSGGPYNGQANTVFNETFEFADSDCYTFGIYDSYGDGICCTYGIGYYKLMEEDNTVFVEGGEFGSEEFSPFSIGGPPPPPGDCENFDALTVGGYVAEQLGDPWTTWSGAPGGSEDATVSDMYSVSPGNSFVVDAGTIDLVLKLDDEPITEGQWMYSHNIYVPAGFSGYFNMQSDPTPGQEWVVEIFFNDDGSGNITENSVVTDFTFEQDTWIQVEIVIDFDASQGQVWFDGEMFYEWDLITTIGGIDYYGWDVGGTPGAYYDDVCFEEVEIINEDCENFDALTVGGYVAEQLGDPWTTWSGAPGGSEDATVSDMYSVSPGNSFVVDAGTIDLVLKLGQEPITEGQWVYSHMTYIPAGVSGYFNMQSDPTPGQEWVVEVFFNDDGSGNVTQNSVVTDFTFAHDTWIFVEVAIDLATSQGQVWFDGELFYQWELTTTIGGIDYYGWDVGGTPGAYYDDVCFEEGWDIVPTSIEELNTETLVIYPNPASDVLNISLNQEINKVLVFDYTGNLVISQQADGNAVSINTSHLSTGVYIVRVMTNDGISTKQVVIK